MAARRNRRRRRRNRGRFGFLYKLLSVLLIFAAVLTGCVVFFRVNKIIVTGESQYTEEEIIKASGVQIGDNLFRINKFQIKHMVSTSLPYVDEMSIYRNLPDTLVLSVSECVPVAVVQGDGAYWLMDARCKLLQRGDAALAQGQAVIRGITPLAPTVGVPLAADEEELSRLGSLRGLLSALDAEQMTGSVRDFIDLTAENKIRFSYGDKLTVVVPMSVSDFSDYVYRLKRTLWEMDDRGVSRTGTLDLTYEDKKAHLFSERWLPEEGLSVPESAPQPTPQATPQPSAGPVTEPVQRGDSQTQGETQ